ncbi:unnamed protein product [Didymodactylos carnosus]|uniref:Uncharacterized protein n=1 Tax=Didymodactylos carnosus TaxID=1234261 RepID=A0A8S2QK50_9BILA|nr:unnamed protein product [Didymodactylos carnosus]CAF4107577.1 unnamed protein product [Didymodactylos carnosus]
MVPCSVTKKLLTPAMMSIAIPKNELLINLTQFIQEYLNSENNHEKWLIISCGTGLGNRLQTMISGFVMSMLMNRRFIIDWHPTYLHGCHFNDLFDALPATTDNIFNLYDTKYILAHSYYLVFHGPFDELLCENLTTYFSRYQFLFLHTDEYFLSVLIKNLLYSKTIFKNINEDHLFQTLISYLFVPKNKQLLMNETKCDIGIHMRKRGVRELKNNDETLFLGM